MCDELQSVGATVIYPHPVFNAFPDDGSLGAFSASPRPVEARELVVDAALGAVDAVDIVSPFDDEGGIEAYLDENVRRGVSVWASVGPDAEQRAVRRLHEDLASGRCAERNRDLLDLDAAELGSIFRCQLWLHRSPLPRGQATSARANTARLWICGCRCYAMGT